MSLAAVYARVSTHEQAEHGTSLSSQIEQCVEKAKQIGYDKIEVFKDDDTGYLIDRPGLNELRENLKLGKYDVLIANNPDRLARKLAFQLLISEEVKKAGARLVFLTTETGETPEQNLLFQMQGVIAEYERAKIQGRTTGGRLARAKQGKVMPMGAIPFGYDYDSEEGVLSVNEDEAKVVEMIYRWYADEKLTMRQLGTRLVEMGISSRKGGKWGASSIRRILQNEIYVGKFYYNRRQTKLVDGAKTKGGKKKRVYSMRDPEEWVEIEVPAIIDEGLWQRAQEQCTKNTKFSKRNTKFDYLLRGLLVCGNCGARWSCTSATTKVQGERRAYPVYRCNRRYTRRYPEGEEERCTGRAVNARAVDDYAWSEITKLIKDPQLLAAQLDDIEKDEQEIPLEELLEMNKASLDKCNRERNKVIRLYRQDLISNDETEAQLREMKIRQEKLAEEIKELEDKVRERQEREAGVKQLMAASKEIVAVLNEELDFERKRSIVENLINYVIINVQGDEVSLKFIASLPVEPEGKAQLGQSNLLNLSSQPHTNDPR